MRCPHCNSRSVARVSVFHATHPAGRWVGWGLLGLAVAGAAWAAWCALHPGPKESIVATVPNVLYAAMLGLVTGMALIWRYRAPLG
jgi:hypothetical protein